MDGARAGSRTKFNPDEHRPAFSPLIRGNLPSRHPRKQKYAFVLACTVFTRSPQNQSYPLAHTLSLTRVLAQRTVPARIRLPTTPTPETDTNANTAPETDTNANTGSPSHSPKSIVLLHEVSFLVMLHFNLALSSFEPYVRGTRNIIDLAPSSPWDPKPRFMFTSSVSSAQSWDRAKGPFPEEVQDDAGVAVGLGYGTNKYVCEWVTGILIQSRPNIRRISARSLVDDGLASDHRQVDREPGCTCRSPRIVSWIPPHVVSNVILDVAFVEVEPPIAVNLVYPRPIAWKTLMQPVADRISELKITSNPIPLAPFSEHFR
ncbi:hypothetical protein M405DRAFT_870173 [Rhizopogon salebrosus TDB-379]|nr:hypothetical protein M405DRAFT_870173 [Rhizopogon salebrosus TDB-379]